MYTQNNNQCTDVNMLQHKNCVAIKGKERERGLTSRQEPINDGALMKKCLATCMTCPKT